MPLTGHKEELPGTCRDDRPLVVDLDGTLLLSDMMAETFLAVLSSRPLAVLAALPSLRHGRAGLKASLADRAVLPLASLPWNRSLLDWIDAARARGRAVYLASASDRRIVEAVAAHLAIFDGVFASDGVVNLKSGAKARALCAAFGAGRFDYAGNEVADLAVWEQAGGVVAVNLRASLLARVRQRWPGLTVIPARRPGWPDYAELVEGGQWPATLLAVLPVLTDGRVTAASLAAAAAAGIAAAFAAAAMAVLGQLLTLGRDRRSPAGRRGVFARGRLTPGSGLVALLGLALAALLIAALLPAGFLAILALQAVTALVVACRLEGRVARAVGLGLSCLIRLAGGLVVTDAAATVPALAVWGAAAAIVILAGRRADRSSGRPAA